MAARRCLLLLILVLTGACARSPATAFSVTPRPSASATIDARERPVSAAGESTPAPSDTPTLAPDQIVATLEALERPVGGDQLRSPDQHWLAQVLTYRCAPADAAEQYAYDQLVVTETRTGSRTTVDSQLQFCGGLGAYGLAPRFWSVDGRFLYYTNAREGVPDGCGYWERPTLRLDTSDWTIVNLGAGPVSPDGSKIAAWWGSELAVWQLTGGKVAAVPELEQGRIPGPIAWSPDSRSIAYLLSSNYCPLGRTDVMRLDLETAQPVLLLTSDTPSFAAIRWDAPSRITLSDMEGGSWRYNLVTGDLRPVMR